MSLVQRFLNERDTITEYVMTLKPGEGLAKNLGEDATLAAVLSGYERFKAERAAREVSDIAVKHGLPTEALQSFVDAILARRIFDGEQLTELFSPLALGWKVRAQRETALMNDLIPILVKRSGGLDISGLAAYTH